MTHAPSKAEFTNGTLPAADYSRELVAADFIQKWYRRWRNESCVSLKRHLIVLRNTAAGVIQRNMRKWLTHKLYKLVSSGLLIKWEHPGTSVSLIGNFTSPPWDERITLKYSPLLSCYISTVLIDRKIPPGAYCIKFLIDGQWKCSAELPISIDSHQNYNNVFIVQALHKGIHRSLKLRSISDELIPNGVIVKSQKNSPILLAKSLSNSSTPYKSAVSEHQEVKDIRLVMGSHMISKARGRGSDEKSSDSLFIDEEIQAFGIADGVGEWATYGLDPSLFPCELIKNLHEALTNPDDSLDQCLLSALYSTSAFGSSTLLAGTCKDSLLHTLSLGDSIMLILRPRESTNSLIPIYRSSEQQHSFNCPYQLSRLPEPKDYEKLKLAGLSRLVKLLKIRKKQESVMDAAQDIIPLFKDDVIVVATDGLFDNLFDQDIVDVAEKCRKKWEGREFVEGTAKELAEEATRKSWDREYRSPFAKKAAKAGRQCIGGKLDDVSVIVILAVECSF